MDKKFNCYKCDYRGMVPGDAHSCCNHPEVKQGDAAKKLNIKGHPQGIRSGWFNWPYNFDPTWLVNCDGFKETSPCTETT